MKYKSPHSTFVFTRLDRDLYLIEIEGLLGEQRLYLNPKDFLFFKRIITSRTSMANADINAPRPELALKTKIALCRARKKREGNKK